MSLFNGGKCITVTGTPVHSYFLLPNIWVCKPCTIWHKLHLNLHMKQNASFKAKTDSTSHLELHNSENVSLSKGYAKLFFAILIFRGLKFVTTLLSFVSVLLINILGWSRVKTLLLICLSNTIISSVCKSRPYLPPLHGMV